MSNSFYASYEWQRLRYATLRKYGFRCMACGQNGEIHVDHIKPRSKFPELEKDPENLQVLCRDCNLGKKNEFEDDLRPGARSSSCRVDKEDRDEEDPLFPKCGFWTSKEARIFETHLNNAKGPASWSYGALMSKYGRIYESYLYFKSKGLTR